MRLEDLKQAALKQQELTQRTDAPVVFFVNGKWPNGDRKRLAGKRGPLGRCLVEYEDCVMCEFKANEVLDFVGKYLG